MSTNMSTEAQNEHESSSRMSIVDDILHCPSNLFMSRVQDHLNVKFTIAEYDALSDADSWTEFSNAVYAVHGSLIQEFETVALALIEATFCQECRMWASHIRLALSSFDIDCSIGATHGISI